MSEMKKNKTKEEKPVSAYYKIEKNKVKRLLPTCDRCGPGYFMANHGDRYSCGHCGYTRYNINNKNEK